MAVAGFRTAEQTVDARGCECALLLVVVSHPLAAAGLANSLGRMTLYPPRSFTSTNVHCDLVFCYNNQMLQVLKRCCCVNNKKKKSSPRLTLLRTVASTCFFVRSNLTLCYSVNSQRNARPVDKESIWRRRKVTFSAAAQPILTLLDLKTLLLRHCFIVTFL